MKLSTHNRSSLQQLVSLLVVTLLSLIMAGHSAAAASGRGTTGFGLGSSANCFPKDGSSAQLFHSSCSHVWRTDGGASSHQQLIGRWSRFEGTSAGSYVFYPNGRYERSSQVGYDGQVRNLEQQGQYRLQGNELVTRPDNPNSPTMRFQISWHEEMNQGRRIRGMTLVGVLGVPGDPLSPPFPFEEHYYYEGQP
jgi:hypothetical protein